jgi:aspartyl-tRNA synthetase
MKSKMRTHDCGALRKQDIGQKVTLSGWVHRRRDHGGLIFIDLRDYRGLTQLVFDPDTNPTSHKLAHQLRSEWVICVHGTVIPRSHGMENPKMLTGEIEIKIDNLTILSEAKTPPFSICDEEEVREELRLKYRYLDMRRGPILNNLRMRNKVMLSTRNFLSEQGFCEVSTPILTKSTPEGARDYLVPSRVHPGNFYALPQSPQMFKQILMIGGLDRYFQICSCFRDEDLRADRQPEFTQIDIEMSFDEPESLFAIIESLFEHLYSTVLNHSIATPFQRLTYATCMEDYGTDKPDLRIPIKLIRIEDLARRSTFSVFLSQLESGGTIKGMKIPGGASISRKKIDDYTAFVNQFGVKGLAWMKFQNGELSSSIVKFFDEALQKELLKKFEVQEGDLLFFVADEEDAVNQSLDHLRRHIARDHGLIEPKNAFLWVTDFPLFIRGENGELEACHHPFTAPHPEDVHLLAENPLKARSMSYDLVLNGYELASGSQRIHDSNVQKKMFSLLKLSEAEIQVKFGAFVEALRFGTPPHLGIALGLDRMMMIILQTENIKDVVAFPKTQKAADLMLEAPSVVNSTQLKELKLEIQT